MMQYFSPLKSVFVMVQIRNLEFAYCHFLTILRLPVPGSKKHINDTHILQNKAKLVLRSSMHPCPGDWMTNHRDQ